jgi:HK97 family phage major capsid protein
MDSYKKLRAENDARYRQMSELIEKANQAGGDLSAEDTKTFDSLDAEYRRVQGVIEKNHQLMSLAAKDREAGFVDVGPDAPEVRRAPAARETAQRAPRFGDFRCSDEYETAYATYLKRGEHTPVAEMRALSEGTAGSGDVLPPTEFHQELSKRLQNIVALRKIARVMPLGSWKREIAFETALPSASFVAEGSAVTSEGGSTFSNRVLTPRRLAGLALVSNELMEDAPARGPGFSLESILVEQFSRKFGEVEESNFLVGNGTAPNPKGILTYTTGTNTTVNTGATMGGTVASPALTAANVIDWIYSIPRQYRQHPSCAIVTSDTVLGMIRKLAATSATTQLGYFWQPSGMLGEPDRLMGIPVYASAYVNSITAGSVIGIAGAFDYCVIGERSGFTVKVLRERYAETNQSGIYCQSRVDVTLAQTEAFTYLKSPAS